VGVGTRGAGYYVVGKKRGSRVYADEVFCRLLAKINE
jgi:hypothetical protein